MNKTNLTTCLASEKEYENSLQKKNENMVKRVKI